MTKTQLFDNIMQVIHVENTIAGVVIVSTEIDFELPRGFVAKIHKVCVDATDVFDKIAAADQWRGHFALLLDPDDATTVVMPLNTVEHDVILSGQFQVMGKAIDEGKLFTELWRQYDFSHLEGFDIISARNMRWNTLADTDNVDDAGHGVFVYYTLEEIKDTQIMELLDIL